MRSANPSAEARTRHFVTKLHGRFDPRFEVLTVPASSALASKLDRGVTFCASKAGQGFRKKFATTLAKDMESEYCNLLCAYFNEIARAIVGPSYQDLFWNTSTGSLKTGNARMHTGSESDPNKPDLVVTCEPFTARKDHTRPDWNQLAAVFEVKCQQQKDMDFTKSLGQLARFVVSHGFSSHNPAVLITCFCVELTHQS
jgi:hypothetical protein